MQVLRSLGQLLLACGQWFYRSTINPPHQKESVPPIRYDGDMQDIYLA